MRATCSLSRQNLVIFFLKMALGRVRLLRRRGTSASETTKGRARPSQTRAARARAMIRGTSRMRGVIHVACALALALACSPTRARAQPLHRKTNATGASRFDKADPHGVLETPPVVISLPVVLAPVPDLDRDDDTGVAARARSRRTFRAISTSRTAEGPRRGGLRREGEERRRRIFFPRTRRTLVASNCHSNEHCADAVYGRPTIGHGSPRLYPTVVRGVHAPHGVYLRPPADVHVFRSVPFARPWGYYCVLVPSKDDPNGPPPPIDAPSPPPPIDAPSPPPSPLGAAQCGDPPVGPRATSRRASTPAACVCSWTRAFLSRCCGAECDTVFGDCCADKRSCCDERKAERRFGEGRADFRGENRGVGETRVDSLTLSNSIRLKKTKNKNNLRRGFFFF